MSGNKNGGQNSYFNFVSSGVQLDPNSRAAAPQYQQSTSTSTKQPVQQGFIHQFPTTKQPVQHGFIHQFPKRSQKQLDSDVWDTKEKSRFVPSTFKEVEQSVPQTVRSKNSNQYYCKVCKEDLHTKQAFQLHKQSYSHAQKSLFDSLGGDDDEAAGTSGREEELKSYEPNPVFTCCVCNIEMETEAKFRSHCNGIIHLRQCNDRGIEPEVPLNKALGISPPKPASKPPSNDLLAQAWLTLSAASKSGPLANLLAAQKQKTEAAAAALASAAPQNSVAPMQSLQSQQKAPAPTPAPQPKTTTYYCSSCHATCPTRDEYVSHCYYVHNQAPEEEATTKKGKFYCDVCDVDMPTSNAFTLHFSSLIHTQNAANRKRARDTKLMSQNKKLKKQTDSHLLEAKKRELLQNLAAQTIIEPETVFTSAPEITTFTSSAQSMAFASIFSETPVPEESTVVTSAAESTIESTALTSTANTTVFASTASSTAATATSATATSATATSAATATATTAAPGTTHDDELNSFYSSLGDSSKDDTNTELEDLLKQLKELQEKKEEIKLKKAVIESASQVMDLPPTSTAALSTVAPIRDRSLEIERLRTLQLQLRQLDEEEMRDRARASSRYRPGNVELEELRRAASYRLAERARIRQIMAVEVAAQRYDDYPPRRGGPRDDLRGPRGGGDSYRGGRERSPDKAYPWDDITKRRTSTDDVLPVDHRRAPSPFKSGARKPRSRSRSRSRSQSSATSWSRGGGYQGGRGRGGYNHPPKTFLQHRSGYLRDRRSRSRNRSRSRSKRGHKRRSRTRSRSSSSSSSTSRSSTERKKLRSRSRSSDYSDNSQSGYKSRKRSIRKRRSRSTSSSRSLKRKYALSPVPSWNSRRTREREGKPIVIELEEDDKVKKATEKKDIKEEKEVVKNEAAPTKSEAIKKEIKTEDTKTPDDKEKKSEDGEKKTEDGEKKTEDGEKKTEDGEKKTDDGEKKSEDGEKTEEEKNPEEENEKDSTADKDNKKADGEEELSPLELMRKNIPNALDYYCEVCNSQMTGPHVFKAHMDGGRHARNVAKAETAAVAAESAARAGENPTQDDADKPRCQEVFDKYSGALIGLQYVTEFTSVNLKVDARYVCNLCEEKKCDGNTLLSHLVSQKHRLNYMKQCYMNYFTMLRQSQPRKVEQAEIFDNYARQIEEQEGRKAMKKVVEPDPFARKPAPEKPDEKPKAEEEEKPSKYRKRKYSSSSGSSKSRSRSRSRRPSKAHSRRSRSRKSRSRSRHRSRERRHSRSPSRHHKRDDDRGNDRHDRDRGTPALWRPYPPRGGRGRGRGGGSYDDSYNNGPPLRRPDPYGPDTYDPYSRDADPYAMDRDPYGRPPPPRRPPPGGDPYGPPRGPHPYGPPPRDPHDPYGPRHPPHDPRDPYARGNPYDPLPLGPHDPYGPPPRGPHDPYGPPPRGPHDPYDSLPRGPLDPYADSYAAARDPYGALPPLPRGPRDPMVDAYAAARDPYSRDQDPYAAGRPLPRDAPGAASNDPYGQDSQDSFAAGAKEGDSNASSSSKEKKKTPQQKPLPPSLVANYDEEEDE